MALKRKVRRNEAFSMASMTDIIFLLLIFFMVLSTLVVPNAIKVNLPASQSTAPATSPAARITITDTPQYFLGVDNQSPQEYASIQEMSTELVAIAQDTPDAYVALYADALVPYEEVVEVLNVVSSVGLKLVLATEVLKTPQTLQQNDAEI